MNRKLLYVLADGGRARFVRRSAETGDFTTIDEIDQGRQLRQLREELRGSPRVRTHDSLGDGRHSVGSEDYFRSAKEAFMAQVADRAVVLAQQERLAGVFLVAPSRLLGVLRRNLEGRIPIAGQLRKDLTKSADHDLAAWLGGAPGPRPRNEEVR